MRRGPRGSKFWPYYAKLAEQQGWTKSAEDLQHRWWNSEKRRMRRRDRREGKEALRKEARDT